jgi:Cu(I)/Ag(I) efflux system protein CusF
VRVRTARLRRVPDVLLSATGLIDIKTQNRVGARNSAAHAGQETSSMITHATRPIVLGLSLLALTGCVSAGPAVANQSQTASVPVGVDLGPSTRIPAAMTMADAGGMPMPGKGHGRSASTAEAGNVQLAHEGQNDAHAIGTVNSVDLAQHKINLSHEPVPQLGWPAMTMDFAVAPSVNLGALKAGTRVNVTLEKGRNGMYEIQSVQPAGMRR